MDVMLDVWRAATQHLDFGAFVDRITPMLRPAMPLEALVVRTVNVPLSRVETAAASLSGGGTLPERTVRSCSPDELSALLSWTRRGSVLQGTADSGNPLLRTLVPAEDAGDWLAAPLARQEHPIGALLCLASPPVTFEPAHRAIALAVAEGVVAAYGRATEHQELVRLREAVEADNRALLSRLERDSVLDAIVGADAGLRDVIGRIEQVAPTDVPVLILGETGSGKEVLARAIHGRSRRAAAPVVRVNCGAISPGLIDSELFGHERGSFTGAVNVRKGWFERADGGTLFLDEIGELPPEAQVRLLRILQDGTFERVGGHRPLRVDVRVVAATHRDLQAMVSEGTFREDLWYRISVFPIELPPLRERLEDLPALASHFAQRAGRRLGGAPLTVSKDDIALLTAYHWPGNVRELATVIERAAILGDGRALHLQAALGPVGRRASRPAADAVRRTAVAAPASARPLTLDEAVKAHITDALRATYGRIEGPFGAAARLGVNPHTLRARMRKLGIRWSAYRRSSGTSA
jgi:transcriptional regulator with GAF, ATPase, and Fis domain